MLPNSLSIDNPLCLRQALRVSDLPRAISAVHTSELHPCAYLPGRLARSDYFFAFQLSPPEYERLLGQGWRRSGQVIYRNSCPDCQLCLQLRVAADRFELSPSQKRCQRRNQDITLSISSELDHGPALELYSRYQTGWHQATTAPDSADIRAFLAESAVETVLTLYHQGTRLLGAGWVDVLANGLSSVYFAFDPQESKRSLGVYSLLAEIEMVQRIGLKWLYLGFMVPGCPAMEYKQRYGPHEILIEGHWQGDPRPASLARLIAANPGQASTS